MNQISLAGDWQVTWTSGQHGPRDQHLGVMGDPGRYRTFTFPGSVQRNLEQASLMSDPRVGIHSLEARWVEEQYWILRRTFEVPPEAVGQPAYLHIGVLDGVAQLALNGQVIGEQANAHRPAVFDLGGRLQAGQNELTIRLESGLFSVADLPGADYSTALETLLNKRHHLRQAQYQFGWDWNPRLVYLGLHGALEVVWGQDPWLTQVTVLAELSEDLKTARIRLRPRFRYAGSQPLLVMLRVASLAGLSAAQEVVIQPGEGEAEVTLDVPQPRLWWPRGHGEPFLYPLALTVEAGGQEIGRWQGQTGLRRVALSQHPHPEGGRYFHLVINNRPIFCKGANWVPPELSAHEVSPERVAALVSLAEAENMNMLRLWGGGVWANHTLLDLCDERGILVWHDLLFACSKYPGDRPDFLAEVEREVCWGAREFSPHPSLVVWCGNNELEVALWEWNYKGMGRTAPDYVLFHQVIPAALARIDPTRPYWPSSPYSSPSEPPNSPLTGDQHPWDVSLGKGDINFWAYRTYVDRFPNEGGVLGCAPLASLRRFLKPHELQARSFAWEHHDNTIHFWHAAPGGAYRMMEHWLGCPAEAMDLETYTLASGLLQAEALKEYILNYRRRWPSTSAAIYWMFNDSWPTVHGWGTFDYYLNRKLSFHPVRRAFADAVVVMADEGEAVGVYVVNDSPRPLPVTVDCGHFDPVGQLHQGRPSALVVPPFTSRRALELSRDPLRVYYAVLRDEQGRLLGQDRLLMRPFGAWQLRAPEIDVREVTREGQRFACYQSEGWVWNVVLDPSGETPLADDVFDLLPGVPYEVALGPGEAAPPVRFTGNQLLKG